ncbi:MAG: shikimate dehydrogenase [Polynucleobacter sp.]|jgi:shikimate dehydrogenase|nr:shikimate dehydrogenase [Polynucleobacter sp.]
MDIKLFYDQVDPAAILGRTCYAVVGNPIGHSRSPWIHQRFAEQAEQKMYYGRIQPPVEQFNANAQAFFQQGGHGLNITVPFKLEACAFAKQLTARAQLAGAVNTLWQEAGQINGDNTDGLGLVRDLDAQGIELKGMKILILGAGGAARGIIGPLLTEGPAVMMIANRSLGKAKHLAILFGELAQSVEATLLAESIDDLATQTSSGVLGQFDLVINATAASLDVLSPLSDQVAAQLFQPRTFAYDLVYGKPTPFMQQALQHGSRVSDGLGMLVEQAAAAFLIWRGASFSSAINPRQVLAELRHALA